MQQASSWPAYFAFCLAFLNKFYIGDFILKKLSLANIAIAILDILPPDHRAIPFTSISENALNIRIFKSLSVWDSHPRLKIDGFMIY
jgi:hypothetical protein